ncbi:Crp/Fnr family transcriptional regulator [Gynurincola endophyticus]|uniref:Crp/Fnr family transcriptional regulator n=1 Tax=Gynurincola endophyticus TaxID=2479004 RepID=UPI000F8D883E|nr:Crp/Fnr family transcriptional regulator [Gynurincola endophyticus]
MWDSFKELIARFTTIDQHAFDSAKPYFHAEKLQKGAYFIRHGEICKQLAYIHQGLLRSFFVDEKGNEITYCFCTDNDIETSFKSFITHTPSELSIQALEDTTLLVIYQKDLQYLLDKFIFWNKISRLLTEKEYLKMEEHASQSKTDLAKEKYLRLLRERPQLLQKVPLYYIASYLGISNRHLTRLRKEICTA